MTALPGGSRRFRYGVGALLAAAALVLAGCGAGQRAATSVETPVVDGVSANVGDINIRDAAVTAPGGPVWPAGSNATLNLVIINAGTTDDSLISASSPAAKGVYFFLDNALATTIPSAAASTTSAPASASASSSDSSSDAASASASPSVTLPPLATDSIDLPAGQSVGIGRSSSDVAIRLTGLTADLHPSTPITITLTFKNAGSVTFQLAVALTTNPPSAPVLATTHAESGN